MSAFSFFVKKNTVTARVLSSFSSYAHDVRRLLPQDRSPVRSGIVPILAVRASNRNRLNGTASAVAVAEADLAGSVRRSADRHREVAIADPATVDLATASAVAEPAALPSDH